MELLRGTITCVELFMSGIYTWNLYVNNLYVNLYMEFLRGTIRGIYPPLSRSGYRGAIEHDVIVNGEGEGGGKKPIKQKFLE